MNICKLSALILNLYRFLRVFSVGVTRDRLLQPAGSWGVPFCLASQGVVLRDQLTFKMMPQEPADGPPGTVARHLPPLIILDYH